MDSKRTILMVDDVGMFRDLGALFLARTARVVTATGGEDALALARRERPDLIVTDLHMPAPDGEALCRMVKADPDLGETPVIIVVGGSQPKDRARAVRAGADDLLCKPLSRLQLIEAVNRFLRAQVRGLPRIEVDEPVRIVARQAEAWGTVRNLSRGGLFVETDCSLAPADEVDLQFSLPEAAAEIEPSAQVIWRRDTNGEPRGMGMRFLAVDGATVRRLEDFVFEHSRFAELRQGAAR